METAESYIRKLIREVLNQENTIALYHGTLLSSYNQMPNNKPFDAQFTPMWDDAVMYALMGGEGRFLSAVKELQGEDGFDEVWDNRYNDYLGVLKYVFPKGDKPVVLKTIYKLKNGETKKAFGYEKYLTLTKKEVEAIQIDFDEYYKVDPQFATMDNYFGHYEESRKYIKKLIREAMEKQVLINNYEDIFKYTPEQIVDEFGAEGFNSEENAIEELAEVLNADFPYGLKNVPEKLILYRVLFLKDPKKYNLKNFGHHYIASKMLIDGDFLLRMGGENFDWDETPPYVFKVEIDRNEIDFSHTISNNLNHPREFEITTKSANPQIKVLEIKPY